MSDRPLSPPPRSSSPVSPAWAAAVRLLLRWLEQSERADSLLEGLPKDLSRVERARVQHLFFGTLRHLGRLERELERWVSNPPRMRLRALLLVAGFELIEGGEEGHVARVVHHAVEQAKAMASPSEARLVNAVLRKMAVGLSVPLEASSLSGTALADAFSHPEWLVRRWISAWGEGPTRSLLALHQTPGPMHARWRDSNSTPPDWFVRTPLTEFFELPPGRWGEIEPLLKSGQIYLQDPSTRLAVDLLEPVPGEALVDACAAPGGKSLLIADRLQRGRVFALELPGLRIERLKENLARVKTVDAICVAVDLLKMPGQELARRGFPQTFPGVLVDVPCSNTGVMRHRVDVKWRLQPGDFASHARQQAGLLRAASTLVAPGGRLVYSTCSLDAEENEQVVESFVASAGGLWALEAQARSRPWETGTDGAGAFRLRRQA